MLLKRNVRNKWTSCWRERRECEQGQVGVEAGWAVRRCDGTNGLQLIAGLRQDGLASELVSYRLWWRIDEVESPKNWGAPT